jgi:hypothetical protein
MAAFDQAETGGHEIESVKATLPTTEKEKKKKESGLIL